MVLFCVNSLVVMLLNRRSVHWLVCGVGLLFGYTLTQIITSLLHTRSINGPNYSVPPAPHSHGDKDGHMPAFSAVQRHDFDENSQISMSTFSFHSYM